MDEDVDAFTAGKDLTRRHGAGGNTGRSLLDATVRSAALRLRRPVIAELRPGRGFDEQSTMLSMRSWRHERSLDPAGEAKTVVRDRLTFELKAPLRLLTPVIAAGIGALFGHRQRRLQRHFATG